MFGTVDPSIQTRSAASRYTPPSWTTESTLLNSSRTGSASGSSHSRTPLRYAVQDLRRDEHFLRDDKRWQNVSGSVRTGEPRERRDRGAPAFEDRQARGAGHDA